jgi:hypothetical protein
VDRLIVSPGEVFYAVPGLMGTPMLQKSSY